MREELVEMAVKFLCHPNVSSALVSERRSFLEKRGLTSDEIEEAFRRVTDTTSTVSFGQDINSNQDVQSKSSASMQLQGTGQSSQPPASSMLTASPPPQFSWLKSWICKVVLEEDDDKGRNSNLCLSKEAIEAAKAAAAASVNAAKTSLEILQSKKEEGRYLDMLVRSLGSHIAELRSMNRTLQRLEGAKEDALQKLAEQHMRHTSQNGPGSKPSGSSIAHRADPGNFVSSSTKFKPSDVPNFDSSVRPSSAPFRTSSGQHSKSYTENLAMIQRGEKPPGTKDIDDSLPNPRQLLPNPRLTPRIKPWEIAQTHNNFADPPYKAPAQVNGENVQPWWKRNNAKIREIEAGNGMRTIS